MVYAYLRVSTGKQDGRNQRIGVEALELRRAQGIHIGRQFGSKNSYTKITGKENWIKEQLNKGVPKTEIAKALKIDRSTLWRYIRSGRV